jgi:hypothetical protein
MKELQVVPTAYIQQVWATVEKYLADGLVQSGGEYNVDQLKVFLTQGSQVLLIVTNADKIIGAFSIVFENYPNDRIAFITSVGGRMIADKALWPKFEDWCRSQGATKIRGAAFESVAELWRRQFDVQTRYVIVEKSL